MPLPDNWAMWGDEPWVVASEIIDIGERCAEATVAHRPLGAHIAIGDKIRFEIPEGAAVRKVVAPNGEAWQQIPFGLIYAHWQAPNNA